MEWKDILETIVMVVIIPSIPVLVREIVRYFRAETDSALSEVSNETLRQVLGEATDAIYTAVVYTSQVYVDAMKDKQAFDKEAQQQALGMAIDKAKAMLTVEAKDLLTSLYGNLDEWLTVRIEQTVRDQKQLTA